jgi:hypothetical protein
MPLPISTVDIHDSVDFGDGYGVLPAARHSHSVAWQGGPVVDLACVIPQPCVQVRAPSKDKAADSVQGIRRDSRRAGGGWRWGLHGPAPLY